MVLENKAAAKPIRIPKINNIHKLFNGIDSRSTILNIKYPENVPVVANLSNLEIKVANNTEEADVKKIEGENLL